MITETVVVGPFQCNCRILVCPQTGKAVVVDPGDEPRKIIESINHLEQKLGKKVVVEQLLHTHGHLDHIAGTKSVKEEFSVNDQAPKIALHKDDLELYQALNMQGQMFGMQFDEPLPVDLFFEDEQSIQVGTLKLTVIHTPGHSPGSVCFRLHEDSDARSEETLYSGDTLFQGSVGRTDLWGANQDQMFKSIRNRLLTLDDDTHVCPGHGMDSKVGIEKRSNPFLT